MSPSKAAHCAHAGTDQYIAPEVLLSSRYGPKVDVFSLGVACIFCFSGQFPFNTTTFNQFVKKPTTRNRKLLIESYQDQVTQLLKGADRIHELLRAVVSRMLVFTPTERASAAELLESSELVELSTLCGVEIQPDLIPKEAELRSSESLERANSEFDERRRLDIFARFDFDGSGIIEESEQV